jgi:hypothetical protein
VVSTQHNESQRTLTSLLPDVPPGRPWPLMQSSGHLLLDNSPSPASLNKHIHTQLHESDIPLIGVDHHHFAMFSSWFQNAGLMRRPSDGRRWCTILRTCAIERPRPCRSPVAY